MTTMVRNLSGRLLGPGVLALVLASGPALADQTKKDQNPGTQTRQAEQQQQPQQQQQQQQQQATGGTAQPGGGQPPGMELGKASELSQAALTHIVAATTALENNNTKNAQTALDVAASNLHQLYNAVPAGPVLSELGSNQPGKPMNLAPVLGEMRSRSVWMDPEVVAGVEEAQKQLDKGNEEMAEEKLMLARQRLAADVALLPIEDAYARVQAARGELRDGRPQDAARLLRNVPLTIGHIQVAAPLVPVRFNLRAAATAAEEGNWDRAKELVNQANQGIQQMASAPAADQEFQKEIKPIAAKAKQLTTKLEKGGKPRPKEMRDLARQTRSLAATL